MKIPSFLVKMVAASMLATSLFTPFLAHAATTSYTQDTNLTVGGDALVIKEGSTVDSFASNDTTLTVSVPAGEAFEVRTVGNRNALENDQSLPTCDVLRDLSNRMIINGPRQVVITPSMSGCSSAGYDTDKTPSYLFSSPTNGSSVTAGQMYQLFWSTSGQAPSIRIRLSTDNGATYPTTLADGVQDSGYFSWNVPANTVSTNTAKFKIEGIEGGNVIGFSVSRAFAIAGTAPASADACPNVTGVQAAGPCADAQCTASGGTWDSAAQTCSTSNQPSATITPYVYDPADETASAATISIDRALPTSQGLCHPDEQIKVAGMDTVYYCGTDGKRYVFPNRKTHDTWYGDFNGVVTLDLATMGQIPLGGNVTYRPGVKLVKITTSPEVFAVGTDGTLRYVSEAAAVRLYGPNWNKNVDDLPDAFFTNYHIGDPIMQ